MFDNILNIAHLGKIESLTVTDGGWFIIKWYANDFYWQINDEPLDGWFDVTKVEPFYVERNHKDGSPFMYLEWHCYDQTDYYINQDGIVMNFEEFCDLKTEIRKGALA